MSVSNKAKQRGEILDEIMLYHRQELPKLMREVPLANLRALIQVVPAALDFYTAIKKHGVSLIAECKKASPSKGLIVRHYDPVQIAKTYIKGGAVAISVLTDARHFQGSLTDLRDVKEAVAGKKVPVLRKDFIFDPYQVYEARSAGADAVLLIVSVLEGGRLKDLIQLSHELGMCALVEVHTEQELEQAVAAQPKVIGINNRNLQTFEVNLENTGRLREKVPAQIAVVAESGIQSAQDVRQLRDIGVDAILVGEALLRSKELLATVNEFVNAGRKKSVVASS